MKMINIIALDENGNKNEKFASKMNQAEKKRKEYKQDVQKREKEEITRAENQRAQEQMKARMNKVVKKIGKANQVRSEKPAMKKTKVIKEKDPDTVDQENYLGIDLKKLEQDRLAAIALQEAEKVKNFWKCSIVW